MYILELANDQEKQALLDIFHVATKAAGLEGYITKNTLVFIEKIKAVEKPLPLPEKAE